MYELLWLRLLWWVLHHQQHGYKSLIGCSAKWISAWEVQWKKKAPWACRCSVRDFNFSSVGCPFFTTPALHLCHFNFLWDLLSITHCCVSSICLNIQSVLYWLVLAVCSSEAMQQSAYAGANSKNFFFVFFLFCFFVDLIMEQDEKWFVLKGHVHFSFHFMSVSVVFYNCDLVLALKKKLGDHLVLKVWTDLVDRQISPS